MAKNHNEDDEEMTLVLTLDEGDVECSILTIYECGGKDYIVVLPKDKDGNPRMRCIYTDILRMRKVIHQ